MEQTAWEGGKLSTPGDLSKAIYIDNLIGDTALLEVGLDYLTATLATL